MDMMNLSQPPRRPQVGYGFANAWVLGLALVTIGVSSPSGVDGTVSAQAPNPCALLTTDEIESFAANASVGDGIASSLPSFEYVTCRYRWGAGTRRFTLEVIVYDATRRVPAMNPDHIKQQLLASVRPGTAESVISDMGEAAVFRSDSPLYATATAFLKGRILGVHLDGLGAREKKDQAIALLKSAASRL
jgi:hypothetical protein